MHVAAACVEHRPYTSHEDLLQRLFYDVDGLAPGRSPDVRPVEAELLVATKCMLDGLESTSRQHRQGPKSGALPWWDWPEQAACPSSGTEWHDTAFPAGESNSGEPAGRLHAWHNMDSRPRRAAC